MLGEISGHCTTHSRVWLSCGDGGRVRLFRLFCLANYNEHNRSSYTRNEGNYYTFN